MIMFSKNKSLNDVSSIVELGVKVEKVFISYKLLILLLDFYSKSSWSNLYGVLSSLIHQWTNVNLIECLLMDRIDGLDCISQLIVYMLRTYRDNLSHVHKYKSESLENTFKYVNENANELMSLIKSEFGRKMTTILSLLMCVPLVNKLGIDPKLFGYNSEIEKNLRFDYSKYTHLSLFALVIEHTSWVAMKICHMTTLCKTHGVESAIRSLYVSTSDFKQFDDEYVWLRKNSKNFSCRSLVLNDQGQPDPFTLEGYLHRCVVAKNLADKLIVALKHEPAAVHKMQRCKYEILGFQSDCEAELRASEGRPFPYAMMLCGPPGIGKTFIKDSCFIQMHQSDNISGRFEIPYKPSLVYTTNPSDDFYSGFSTEHTSILLDDVAQKTPDILKMTSGDDLADLIQIINSVPFLPNQAELEKKGKTPMRVRYVIGTTNTPDLNVQYVFNCKEAVLRRMVFVECSVKQEYRKQNSVLLQGDIINPNNNDLWEFVIYRYFPTGSSPIKRYWNGTTYGLTEHVLSLEDLMLFIDKDINEHWVQQEKAKLALEHIYKARICRHNISSTICKKCDDEFVAESQFKDFLGNIYHQTLVLCLFIPIYSCLFLGTLNFMIFGPSEAPIPILPLRCARKLIDYIPPHVEKPFYFRIFQWVPSLHINNTFHYIGRSVHLHFKCMCYNLSYKKFSWESFYKKDVVMEWYIPTFLVLFTLFKMVRMFGNSINFQGEAMEKMPHPDDYEKKVSNVWLRQNKIGVFPNVGSTIREYDLCTQVTLNTVRMKFFLRCSSMRENYILTNGFILKSNLVVTVGHVFNSGIPDECLFTFLQKSGEKCEVRFKIDSTCWFEIKERDLIFFRFDRISRGRDLSKYLISNKEPVHINAPGKMFSFDDNFNLVENNLVRVTNFLRTAPYICRGTTYDSSGCYQGYATLPTQAGQCGGPIIVLQGSQKMVAGIHCAGDTKCGTLIRPIYIEDVELASLKLLVSSISDNDFDVAYSGESSQNIVSIHNKCPSLRFKDKELIIIGGNILPRVSPRTQVKRSPCWRDVLSHYKKQFHRIEYTSPIDCDPKKAIAISMDKAVENAQFYPEEIKFAVDSMSKEFIGKFTHDMLLRLHPYPMSVAINGRDGIPYLERLNLSTSGGYGHSGPKRSLFEIGNSCDEHNECYVMTAELEKEVFWLEQQYKSGLEANPVFKCSFKDEPISIEKAEISKVRIFSASPVAFSILTRKYLLCIIREFVSSKRLSFEMAIGANAHGMDWDEIYHHVIKHGEDRCFAGDYKNFDKQMSPELILAAFDVIINILKAANWDDEDLQVVRGIAVDTAFPTMDLFGTLVQFFGSNPSGHVLTTPINSLVNSLYIRMACRRIMIQNGINPSFDDFVNFSSIVSLVTYGDDNCGSVSIKYPYITHTSIQKALSEVGIIYTTDDKKSLSVGLTSIKDITFLKRRFVIDPFLCRCVAPLLEESLFKALTVWTYSKKICVEEQLAAVLESVNREYFFYGKEKFEEKHSFLCTLALKYNVIVYLNDNHLQTWSEIYDSLKL